MLGYGYYLYRRRKAYDKFHAKLKDDVFSIEQYWYICRSRKHYDDLSEEGQLNFLHTFFTDEHTAQKYENLVYDYFKKKMVSDYDIYPEHRAYKEVVENIGDSVFSYRPSTKHCAIVKLPIVNRTALSHAFS